MKIGNPPDYFVRVGEEADEQYDDVAPLYRGILSLDLNYLVSVDFVPDLTDVGPPWRGWVFGPVEDDFSTPQQARLAKLLGARYAVTPNAERAGTEDGFSWSWTDEPAEPGTVFYVSPEEFDELTADLIDLAEIAGGVHSPVRHSAVADRPVVRFVESRVLASRWFDPADAAKIGRDPVNRPAEG